MGDHVYISFKNPLPKTDTLHTSIAYCGCGSDSYTGIVSGFSDTTLLLKVYKIKSSDVTKTYTRQDTSILPEISVPLSHITYFAFTEAEEKTNSAEEIVAYIGIASILLAPIASVNHVQGTFSTTVFWIMIGAGYLVPIVYVSIAPDQSPSYFMYPERPAKPGKSDYYFTVKDQ